MVLGAGAGVSANELFVADVTDRGFTIHTAESAPGMAPTFTAIEGKFGFVPNLLAVMAESPATISSYLSVQTALESSGTLNAQERNVVQLATAEANGCTYCTNAHGMIGEGMLSQDAAEVASLRAGKPIAGNARHEALRAFTVEVIDTRGDVSEEAMEAFLAAGFTRGQALEVVTGIAAKTISNYTNRMAATPLDEPIKSYRDSH
jgi:uncharacterized peroxidase-related enzyme